MFINYYEIKTKSSHITLILLIWINLKCISIYILIFHEIIDFLMIYNNILYKH